MIKQLFLSLLITSFTAHLFVSPDGGAETLPTPEAGTLTLCLPRKLRCFSSWETHRVRVCSLEYEIGIAAAAEFILELETDLFEHDLEEERDLRATYAMLAYPLCDLVSGQPLYKRAMGAFVFERASMPDGSACRKKLISIQGIAKYFAGHIDVKPIDASLAWRVRWRGVLQKRKGLERSCKLTHLGDAILGFQRGSLSGR